ncbi:MAG: acetate kinase [Chloroflexota bacterium]|nr:acetate kinase [Chloroflexota bacterium]MDQ5867555.1 acetate kinase [Chloroflexota bacterium]
MLILVFNCGSSSLKFDLVEVGGNSPAYSVNKVANGTVDRIGPEATIKFSSPQGSYPARKVAAANHKEAVSQALEALAGVSGGLEALDAKIGAIGHRVVQGGGVFAQPTLITGVVLKEIEGLNELAPLHNPAAVAGIRAVLEVFGSDTPNYAVFDTAFHSTLPKHAYTYALPHELAEKHRIRRYGFHGTAHEYMLLQYSHARGIPPSEANIITLQLGNGCSAAAIKGGRSVDTSMGFTPLEGLVMGTRSGDLDPEIVGYLAEKEGVEVAQVEDWLNKRSGLLGVSGRTSDMRDLLAAMETDARARLAVEIFCYRARKYLGAYMAALGGTDGVVFGGGIGENAPLLRDRICADLAWCGLELDAARNAAVVGKAGVISSDASRVMVYVVPVDESLLIARHVVGSVVGEGMG